jgi:hypothetical protein
VVLHPGDLVGRAATAALRVDDGRVSEAHAMVSLRGGQLWLLALRGRLMVRGRPRGEVVWEAGAEVELADGLSLTCDAVELPDHVLALRCDAGAPQALLGTTSLHAGPPVSLRAGHDPDADAVFWTLGDRWRTALRGQSPQWLQAGDRLTVRGVEIEVRLLPSAAAELTRTRPSVRGPARWLVAAETVEAHQAGSVALQLQGLQAQLMACLLARPDAAPAAWLVAEMWPGDRSSPPSLRNRLDVHLARLRERLRVAGLTEVRIGMDGSGAACLALPATDTVHWQLGTGGLADLPARGDDEDRRAVPNLHA